jgi:hypothetical protein
MMISMMLGDDDNYMMMTIIMSVGRSLDILCSLRILSPQLQQTVNSWIVANLFIYDFCCIETQNSNNRQNNYSKVTEVSTFA